MKGKMQMARVRGTILAGRSGRSGRSHQYRLGYGKGTGRRMSTKVMAPEPLPYQPARLANTSGTKTEISREQELRALKEQVRAIEAHLRYLEKRIKDSDPGSTPSALTAFVDRDRCVGCGTCQDVCPARAISVEDIAEVDPERCIGCGICVDQCPRGALALFRFNTGYKNQERVA